MLDRVLACAQLNERNRIRHGQDLFGCNVGEFDTKLIFERHDEFDRVKAVCPQLIDEAAVVGHFALLYTQVLHDDFFSSRPRQPIDCRDFKAAANVQANRDSVAAGRHASLL